MVWYRGAMLSLVLILGSTVFFSIPISQSLLSAEFWYKRETLPYAFATFLANNTEQHEDSDKPIHQNRANQQEMNSYFLGIRVLNYALNYNPATRSVRKGIPLVVLVTDDITSQKRQRLAADGMVVVPVGKIPMTMGMTPAAVRYKDVMTKLRLWTLTDYRKICFIDADTLVTAPLDGVFEDPSTKPRHSYSDNDLSQDEPRPPPSYLFAGRDEAGSYEHHLPPEPQADYLNSGFFVMAPSIEMFDYYGALSRYGSDRTMKGDTFVQDMMGGAFPEQDLLNYAHRSEGPMPWQHLDWRWNIGWPTERDVAAGVKSFHAKFWEQNPAEVDRLKDIWNEQRWQMEGFMHERDEMLMRRL